MGDGNKLFKHDSLACSVILCLQYTSFFRNPWNICIPNFQQRMDCKNVIKMFFIDSSIHLRAAGEDDEWRWWFYLPSQISNIPIEASLQKLIVALLPVLPNLAPIIWSRDYRGVNYKSELQMNQFQIPLKSY